MQSLAPAPAAGGAGASVGLNMVGDQGRRRRGPDGWRWSDHVKPIAGTSSCEVAHTGYVIAGRLRVVMDDGSEGEAGPGDAFVIPPGHDA
jgi:hypothetical protein